MAGDHLGMPSPLLQVRIPPIADKVIATLMEQHDAPRALVVRALLRVAIAHMDEVATQIATYKAETPAKH